VAPISRRLQKVSQHVGKLGRARTPIGLGRNEPVRLCAPKRPLDYSGSAGLFWAINGGKLLELHRDWAVIDLRCTDFSASSTVEMSTRPKSGCPGLKAGRLNGAPYNRVEFRRASLDAPWRKTRLYP
jgi:hypothetical protein